MQRGLQAMVRQVRDSASMIHNSALDIFDGNTELNTRMEQTASSLQETAATMGELATTVRLNTDNAIEADNVTKQAATIAQTGGGAVRTVVGTMNEIEESSAQITEFVNVIDGIVQVNVAVSQMDTVVQRNTELVVQLAGLAGTLQDHAEQLNEAVAQFQVEDQGDVYTLEEVEEEDFENPSMSSGNLKPSLEY